MIKIEEISTKNSRYNKIIIHPIELLNVMLYVNLFCKFNGYRALNFNRSKLTTKSFLNNIIRIHCLFTLTVEIINCNYKLKCSL